jgi:hypothetical protein
MRDFSSSAHSSGILGTTITVVLLCVHSILAQEEMSFQFDGFIDTYHATQSEWPHDYLSSRTRVRTNLRADYGNASLFASLNAVYNSIIEENTGVHLHEAYFIYTNSFAELKAGRQIITWGVADGLRITDLISPMDYTEFMANDYDDIRIPVNGLRLKYLGKSSFQAEIIFIPIPEYFKLPENESNPWSSEWGEKTSVNLENTPEKRLKNSEFGSRITFYLENLDFSVAALHTYNKSPVYLSQYDTTTDSLDIQGIYKTMDMIGGDLSIPIGQCVLRGEFAEYFRESLSTRKQNAVYRKNTTNGLLGLDWYPGDDWTLMFQYAHKYINDYERELASEENTSTITARISKQLFHNLLKMSIAGTVDVNHIGYYARVAADYLLNDQITLSLGYDRFQGDESVFAQYEKNSEIWGKGKYAF